MNKKPEIKCAMVRFFQNESKKHPSIRQKGAMLVCYCPNCNKIKLRKQA